jgi:TPR repeat protein
MSRHHFRTRKEDADLIWYIANVEREVTQAPAAEYATTCQKVDSSCCDLFKTAGELYDLGTAYLCDPQKYMDKETESSDNSEAIRWLMMSCVCDAYYLEAEAFHYLTEFFEETFKNNELVSLFKLERIRKERKIIKSYDDFDNEFHPAFALAGNYFNGRGVHTNYSHAFELYDYCLHLIQRRYEPRLNTKFDVLNAVLETGLNTKLDLLTAILETGPENSGEGKFYIPARDFHWYGLMAYRVGWMLRTGNGVEKDEEAGMKLNSAVESHDYSYIMEMWPYV